MGKLKIEMVILTFITMFIISTCSKEESPEPENKVEPVVTEFGTAVGQADEAPIGPEGGTMNSSDGMLSLSVPQGALSSSTVISIQPITNQAPMGLGKGYRLGPGNISFAKPVTLTFHYTDELLDSKPADFLWIVFQEDDGSWKGLLKSDVNTSSKTVTAETTHFSDWMLGRFIDLELSPKATGLQKGKSLTLGIMGLYQESGDDPLVSLVPIPLDQATELEYHYQIVGWTLNGTKAPVSNQNGSLQPANDAAFYTAPTEVPEPNTVAVTVELEAGEATAKTRYFLTSNIQILENELYIKFIFNGRTYTYYQYGLDGSEMEDPNNFAIATCGIDDENRLIIGGSSYINGNVTDLLEIFYDNPSVGGRGMIGGSDDGKDYMGFYKEGMPHNYDLLKISRTEIDDNCQEEFDDSYNVVFTLTEFSKNFMSEISGSFSGKLFYDGEGYSDACESTDSYPVSGSFHLLLLFSQ